MRRLVLVIAILLMLAACGGGSTDTTVTTVVGTTSNTSVVSTSSSPTITTTTTTTPPTVDTGMIVGSTCALGWWDGSAWQSGPPYPVVGGETYQGVRLTEPIATFTGSAPGPHCEPIGLTSVTFTPPLPVDFFDHDMLAVQTTGNLRPHLVESVALPNATYEATTADLMTSYLGYTPTVNVTQILRADLEGDGVNEVIVTAVTTPSDFLSATTGDYSVVYLRKLVEADVQTAILAINYIEIASPNPADIERHQLVGVMDLNGDGKMEIVIEEHVWEGVYLEVFEYINDDLGPVPVLTCGCGI